MKTLLQAAALAAFATCAALPATPALAQVDPGFRNDKIILLEGKKGDRGYWGTTSLTNPATAVPPERAAIRELMMKRRILEEYAAFLSPLELPRKLRLFASDCQGKEWDSPYYLGALQWIDMCYSFISAAGRDIDEMIANYSTEKWWSPSSRSQLVAGMFVGVLLHETAHALYHLLDIPVFGRQEDAADQMAAYIPLQFDKATARTAIKGFVYLWAYEAIVKKSDPPPGGRPTNNCPDTGCRYADNHGTASQRMYNGVCIAYGGDPQNFQDLVDAGLLTPERAQNCKHEYLKVDAAFKKTVLPFINRGQMDKVRARTWFQENELSEQK